MILEIGIAIKTMQAAFDGIQYCCEALSEGTVKVQKIKKGIENAQTIVKETKNIWSMILGFFGKKKPEPVAQSVEQIEAPKPKAKAKEQYTTHIPDRREIVQQFLGHLSAFFRAHRESTAEVERLFALEYDKDEPDPDVILTLSSYKHELDQSYVRLSGLMRGANVPSELGPLWDNFNEIYEQITDEQQRRREAERINKANDAWQRDQLRRHRIDRALILTGILLGLLWMWPVMYLFGSLVKTRINSLA